MSFGLESPFATFPSTEDSPESHPPDGHLNLLLRRLQTLFVEYSAISRRKFSSLNLLLRRFYPFSASTASVVSPALGSLGCLYDIPANTFPSLPISSPEPTNNGVLGFLFATPHGSFGGVAFGTFYGYRFSGWIGSAGTTGGIGHIVSWEFSWQCPPAIRVREISEIQNGLAHKKLIHHRQLTSTEINILGRQHNGGTEMGKLWKLYKVAVGFLVAPIIILFVFQFSVYQIGSSGNYFGPGKVIKSFFHPLIVYGIPFGYLLTTLFILGSIRVLKWKQKFRRGQFVLFGGIFGAVASFVFSLSTVGQVSSQLQWSLIWLLIGILSGVVTFLWFWNVSIKNNEKFWSIP